MKQAREGRKRKNEEGEEKESLCKSETEKKEFQQNYNSFGMSG